MQNHNYRDYYMNQKGIALVMVMMVLVILSLLGITILTVSAGHLSQTTKDRTFQSSYYIAEAGTNITAMEIQTAVESLYRTANNEATFFQQLEEEIIKEDYVIDNVFSEQYQATPKAIVSVYKTSDANPRSYRIESIGSVNNSNRTVTTNLFVKWQQGTSINLPDNLVAYTGLFSSTNCNVPQARFVGGALLEGNYGTACVAPGAVEISGGATLDGDALYIPLAGDEAILNKAANYDKEIPPFVKKDDLLDADAIQKIFDNYPSIPTYTVPEDETVGDQYNSHPVVDNGNVNITNYQANGYTLQLDRNRSFRDITLTGNRDLYIDTNGEDREITVENLNMNNGHIHLIGDGSLSIYINGAITFGSGSTINRDGSVNKLDLFLAGNNKQFSLAGSQKVNGHLFAEDADVTLTASGGFDGSIISGGNRVELSGGTYNETFILAPFADLYGTAGAKLNGTVISDTLNLSGGTYFSFQEISTDDLPISDGSSNNEIPNDAFLKEQTLEKNK
ncbi:pilus assembly PilX N-terminal domain-containing protein [Gracilibacillus massiliensis]|uniref:pilus assembly PilX N-terminal domain-containing protein n=1 Tax=Gracilibacillus massiliensis TaxID=1564956 RepID=UPI00071D99A5|nr:pilus assembly PilX N-terminal domain-containing protein [Gracilibacillus massiliensis]